MYTLSALIATENVLRQAAEKQKSAVVVPLPQGLALIPNAGEFTQVMRGELAFSGFYKLSNTLVQFAREVSYQGAIAYIEAEFWAGQGFQGCIQWENGEISFAPYRAGNEPDEPDLAKVPLQNMPINTILRKFGVQIVSGKIDEFESIGFDKYRKTADWLVSDP